MRKYVNILLLAVLRVQNAGLNPNFLSSENVLQMYKFIFLESPAEVARKLNFERLPRVFRFYEGFGNFRRDFFFLVKYANSVENNFLSNPS